jgi:hypothetical protein
MGNPVLTYPNATRAVVIPEYDEIDIDIITNNMRTVFSVYPMALADRIGVNPGWDMNSRPYELSP